MILGEWFARLLSRTDLDAEQAFLLGRAAFVAIDGGNRYPGALMTDEPSNEFRTELRSLDAPAALAPVTALFRWARVKGANVA